MKKLLLIVSLIVSVVFSTDYVNDIQPILSQNCAGCHGSSGGFTLSYDNMVNVPSNQSTLDLIEPGSANDSYIWHKINGTQASVGGSGGVMPPSPPLSILNPVRIWILSTAT